MEKHQFAAGAHSSAEFAMEFLVPLFESGAITEFPTAEYYAICYGELCAYGASQKLMAIWSREVPDCASDMGMGVNYDGIHRGAHWKTWRNG